MIKIKDLCFSYGEKEIFNNFSIEALKGEVVCLVGKSGKGKTTLLRIIAGLEKLDSGECNVQGQVCYLFQEDRLLPFQTVINNVMLLGDDKNKALNILEAVGMGEFANFYPSSLSGGMRRRVAIARALYYGGDILLLDEPSTGIDRATFEGIADVILKQYTDKIIVLISHDPYDSQLFHPRIVEV